jgi:hypothetical protein
MMGYIFENGQGVQKDAVEAYMWLDLAAAHSDFIPYDRDLVAKHRDTLAESMTPVQLTEGQKRASEWRPK